MDTLNLKIVIISILKPYDTFTYIRQDAYTTVFIASDSKSTLIVSLVEFPLNIILRLLSCLEKVKPMYLKGNLPHR